jgi:hypothetical protein
MEIKFATDPNTKKKKIVKNIFVILILGFSLEIWFNAPKIVIFWRKENENKFNLLVCKRKTLKSFSPSQYHSEKGSHITPRAVLFKLIEYSHYSISSSILLFFSSK